MNRVALTEKIAKDHQLSKAAAGRIIETVLESIVVAVKKGEGVGFPGFGSFRVVNRAARTGFNPATSQKIKIAARKVVKFVPGAAFAAAVDPKRAAAKSATKKVAKKPAKTAKKVAKKAAKGAKKA